MTLLPQQKKLTTQKLREEIEGIFQRASSASGEGLSPSSSCRDGDMSSCLKKLPEPKSPKPYPLFIPHSTSFSSSHPSSSHLHICLQPLLHHQPCIPPPHPISKIHWHPHPCLMLHLCPSQPAAPCRVKWTVPVSGESRALRSAQRSSAQLGCQRYKLTM